MTLNIIAAEQSNNLIIKINSDALYLGAPKPKSRASGQFFFGWIPQDKQPIKLNGPIHFLTSLLQFVSASVAEAEHARHFVNAKEGKSFILSLKK